MQISEKLETGIPYYWKRTKGWQWGDTKRWWEVFVEISGFNGAGGLWMAEKWRWNGGSEWVIHKPRTLSYEESEDLVAQLEGNLKPQEVASYRTP